jgi:hypothetical protein
MSLQLLVESQCRFVLLFIDNQEMLGAIRIRQEQRGFPQIDVSSVNTNTPLYAI